MFYKRTARRYEIIEELRKGGIRKVYRIEDTKIYEEVALKLIKPYLHQSSQPLRGILNFSNTRVSVFPEGEEFLVML